MARRISLYFDPKAWETMNLILSHLMASGKPLYDMPSMNDLIEGMVVFTLRTIETSPSTLTDLLPYTLGPPSAVMKDRLTGVVNDKGRIAFGVSSRTINSLAKIRELNGAANKKGSGQYLPTDLTDPILIRACVYYVIDSDYFWEFFMDLYISSLYNFRPFILAFDLERYKEGLPELSERERDSLHKIVWDDSVISSLSSLGKNSLFKRKSDFHLNLTDLRSMEYQSRASNFNYYGAMMSFYALLLFDIRDTTMPEIITGAAYYREQDKDWKVNYEWMNDFLTTLEVLKDISKDFNRSSNTERESRKIGPDENASKFKGLTNAPKSYKTTGVDKIPSETEKL